MIVRQLLLLVLPVLLIGCSDIKTDTYEIEYTSDTDPHVVELWYHPRENSNGLAPLYRLRFPQSYYAYRDNHHALKQTTIGLLLERHSLTSLAEVISNETGVNEPLSTPSHEEGALKKFVRTQYRERRLMVRIIGLRGGPTLRRPSSDLSIGETAVPGFQTVKSKRAEPVATDNPDLVGYSLSEPLIMMRCPAGSPSCGFFTDYRNSRLSFHLPRSQADHAAVIARRIIRILDQHRIYTGASK